jgi:hypothetical protein
MSMKQQINTSIALIVGVVFGLCLISLPISSMAGSARVEQNQDKKDISPEQEKAIAAFVDRVKEYVKLREKLQDKAPSISKDATPEEIKAHQEAFTALTRQARAGAKRSDIFTPDIARYIRALIRKEFKGKERVELRETILEADTKGVPLRINYPYPETKELTQIPPTLLLELPQLPKQIRYRFIGRHIVLMDRENHLILDYILDALP